MDRLARMKSILVLLLVAIVTTRFVEAHRQPKVLVYQVSERDGEDPEIQLFKVEDLKDALDEDDDYQDQTLNKYQQYKSRNNEKRKNKQTSNRQSVKFADEYDIDNYKDSNRHRSQNKNRHFTSYKKLNNNYRDLKQKANYRDRNYENIFIDWTKQQGYQNQIYDYLQQKLQQNQKQNARSSKKKQKVEFDDDYFDFGDEKYNRADDVLLSQILNPSKRHKREAERSNIINKLKRLLKRLQELDDDGQAKLEGKVNINKQSDANNWNQDLDSDLVDNTYKRHSIQINRSPALRSGDQLQDELETLVEDRTMPPRSKGKYENPDY